MHTIETVSQHMWEHPLRFRPDQPMTQAIDALLRLSMGAAPVVDAAGNLIGILTDKDSLRTAASWAYDEVAGRGVVAQYMSPVEGKLKPESDLFTATGVFLKTHITGLPVVEGEKLVGWIHRKDLLGGVMKWQRNREARQRRNISDERPASIEALQRAAARGSIS